MSLKSLMQLSTRGPASAAAEPRRAQQQREMPHMKNFYAGFDSTRRIFQAIPASGQSTERHCDIAMLLRVLNGTMHVLTSSYGVDPNLIANTIKRLEPFYLNKFPYTPKVPIDGYVDVISVLLNAQSAGLDELDLDGISRFANYARYYSPMEDGSSTPFRDTPHDSLPRQVRVRLKRGRDEISFNAYMKMGPMFIFDGLADSSSALTLIIHPEDIATADIVTRSVAGEEPRNPFYLHNSEVIVLNDLDDVFIEDEIGRTVLRRGYFQRGYDDASPRTVGGSFTPIDKMGDIIFRSCAHQVTPRSFTQDARVLDALSGPFGSAVLDPLAIPCITLATYMIARHQGIGAKSMAISAAVAQEQEKQDIIRYIGPLGEQGPKTLKTFEKVLHSIRVTDAATSVQFTDVTFVLSFYMVLHIILHGVPPDFVVKKGEDITPSTTARAVLKRAVDYYPGTWGGDKEKKAFEDLLSATKTGYASLAVSDIISAGSSNRKSVGV
uniref:Uncharacterized protein n=1 Tax=viral metagenome TaxID=1070528 RepID=A0A2V0RH40_9ZZZZ